MRRTLAVLLALAQAPQLRASVQSDAVGDSPIQKVVTLLTEIKASVEAEAKQDLEAYDKYACWCETNDKEKSAATSAAEQKIQDLNAFLEEAVGTEGQLRTEVASLEQSIEEAKESLANAASVREKESAAFQAEEADYKETRGLLEQAVDTLSKVQLVQRGAAPAASVGPAQRKAAAVALIQVRNAVATRLPRFKSVMQRDLFAVLGSLEDFEEHPIDQRPSAATVLREAFLPKRAALEQNGQPKVLSDEEAGKARRPGGLDGAAAGAKSYNSRSGAILGILSEMHDEISRDLGSAQRADLDAEVQFQHLRAAKTGEIAAASEQIKLKQAALAELAAKVAQAKSDLAATSKALDADQAFLVQLRKDCTSEAEQYKQRVQDRAEEVRALGEALKVLTEDGARDLFDKTISFLQVGAGQTTESSAERLAREDRATERAMQRLAVVAKRHNNWGLISLAVRVRLDAFAKVKEAMDKMLAELTKQQSEEYQKRELCNKQIDEVEDLIKVGEQTKADLALKHQQLSNSLDTLNSEVEALKTEVKDMEMALKAAGEQRKGQNQLFQSSISDQRATINILKKAQKRLEDFYHKISLVEVHAHIPGLASEAPPPTPENYQKSASAGGVLQLLATIVNDAESTEKELEISEQHSQSAYADFVHVTANSIEQDRALIQEKLAQVAGDDEEKAQTQGSQLANDQELEKLNGLLHGHHVDCDFVLQYFDTRQKARAEEMDAINDAKAILSGANFGK